MEIQCPPQPQLEADMPDALRAMYVMGSHAAKLLTCLTLTTFPPEEYVSSNEINVRLTQLQGATAGWKLGPDVAYGYGKRAFKPLGFIESTTVNRAGQGSPVEVMRLTEKGRHLGTVVAGAMLSLELQSIDKAKAGLPSISLQDIMGVPDVLKGSFERPPTRLSICEALLQHPGQGLSQAELTTMCRINKSTTSVAVRSLLSSGIVTRDNGLVDKRTFALTDRLSEINIDHLPSIELIAMIEAARILQKQGFTQVTLSQWHETAVQVRPRARRDLMKYGFTQWHRRGENGSKIPEIEPAKNLRYQTRIVLAEEHTDYIQELLRIRHLLVDTTPEAADFRRAAKAQAIAILGAPDKVASLMAYAKDKTSFAKGSRAWRDAVPALVPQDGIPLAELHNQIVAVTGKNIEYPWFMRVIAELDGFELVTAKAGQSNRKNPPIVKPLAEPQKQVFPANWVKDAVCKDMDPDLFDPPAGVGRPSDAVLRQAKAAKAICQTCPVKLPCLRKALDNASEDEGIRGGVWIRFLRKEMTQQEIDYIRRNVKIGGQR